jgi:hypothetical protein
MIDLRVVDSVSAHTEPVKRLISARERQHS